MGLDPSAWDAHRKLAQRAADAGHLAVVEEFFTNDASDTETMIYSTLVFPDPYTTPVGQTAEYTRWLHDQDFTEDLEPASPATAAVSEQDWHLDPPTHEDGPLGSAKSYEVFRPGTTGGRYGERTPAELSPTYDEIPPGIAAETRTARRTTNTGSVRAVDPTAVG